MALAKDKEVDVTKFKLQADGSSRGQRLPFATLLRKAEALSPNRVCKLRLLTLPFHHFFTLDRYHLYVSLACRMYLLRIPCSRLIEDDPSLGDEDIDHEEAQRSREPHL